MLAFTVSPESEARRVADDKPLSPAMAQYHRWKVEHKDELLFFRMGDFFELFYDDAKVASDALGLTLTARSKGPDAIPMAGVPVRNVDHYLKKLVALGFRVALCDQIQDPKDADGIVDRAVTRIVTAGTLTEDDLLDRAQPNYLAAVASAPKRTQADASLGLAFLDVSTGDFRVEETASADVVDALLRRGVAEVLIPEAQRDSALADTLKHSGIRSVTLRPDWQFEKTSALEAMAEQYGVSTLDGFGLDKDSPLVIAAGAALRYVAETQKTRLENVTPPRLDAARDRLVLDRATRSCLELTETQREARRDGSLLAVIDQTRSALGARRLRQWLLAPLVQVEPIVARHDAVAELIQLSDGRMALADALSSIGDIERLLTRVVARRANPRDVVQLRDTLRTVPRLASAIGSASSELLSTLRTQLDPHPELSALLGRAIVDDPPLVQKEGGVIRDGYHAELDELRSIRRDGQRYLVEYQQKEIARSGIANLKVGFNSVFGFYIEITNSWKDQVPTDYIRKQTLKNCERYITPELKEYESKVLNAEERANSLESELFEQLCSEIVRHLATLQRTADAIADLDALLSLASVAHLHAWARPQVDDDDALEILDGRHPVIAHRIGQANFVPNDCRMNAGARRLAIVTGPNMAGKSTFIRQVALTQILAQMGSFVPAKSARIGLCDRVFARVGASDDLSRGHSTFMVEMTETANILNNATQKSLVILDEVGRGTSTFDGLSLAWAISEHLLERCRTRTLFATHYHQLIDLEKTHAGVVNLSVAVKEWGDEIVFLHRIVEGGTDKSYGIHVARLAGVPRSVLERAAAILQNVEANAPDLEEKAQGAKPTVKRQQATLFETAEQELARDLKKLDLDKLTPIEALLKLTEWKTRLQKPR